ncbi:hypothetical protein ACX9MO_11885 [Pseudooceanicola sp. 502str34]|uniref:hypothetical protein n=1 Tax=Maritimibacter alkaliphilus TaxID=404236 RepID=UPI001C97CE0A|nr:hypothetical protein [Maritimibacter alkaliphilus]MBY6091959.1 DUF5591 domain-containing protein [Maritimibacter alkaliphilus]
MLNTVTTDDRETRITESREKIQKPFELDPTLCLYSPQDNVDSLEHPRIAQWIDYILHRYEPALPQAEKRVLLMMPCTKTKPYPFSSEHQAINSRLLAEGFAPVGQSYLPEELQDRLEPPFPRDVLNLSVLSNGKGTVIHRAVISEPMALVPYENIAEYEDRPSPATAYDDPGLFEKRGNAVAPWRADSTATRVSATRWKWGEEEKRAYVLMHNEMARILADSLKRIGGCYTDRIAWVAPGLTHRSFVLGREERSAHNVPAYRKVGDARLDLVGANDHLPEGLKIEALPTTDQCKDAIRRLAERLGTDESKVGGVYSRGGANATPLALPELLDVLVSRVSG